MMAKIFHIPYRLFRALWSRGPVGLWHRCLFVVRTWRHERRYGIRTEASIDWAELSDNPDSVDYEASGYDTLRTAFAQLSVTPEDVFLDLGCGMGRPLALAATFPFRRLIGVELSEQLCEVARENLSHCENEGVDVEVLCQKAEHYVIDDDVTVLYMFNPFRGKTLTTVIENLKSSLRRQPRKLTLIYVLPQSQANPFDDAAWLEKKVDAPSEGLRLVIYNTHEASCHALNTGGTR